MGDVENSTEVRRRRRKNSEEWGFLVPFHTARIENGSPPS